ncbi:MAG: phytanoyl-CoA dioxygenase family protein, partial [Planctomycetes bacterium]|nr:phytanoyl-CoA dioxygenase family protein [Planctomycetota bacterium]
EVGAAVPWHQDPPYGDPARTTTFAVPSFTTDIYIDRSTLENGCVWAIPGHHLVGHVPLHGRDQDDLFAHPQAVPIEMEPGDVLFHAVSTPHGSPVNRSRDVRRTFYVHNLCEDVRQDAYLRGWAERFGGWDDARHERLAGMIRERAQLGLEQSTSELCPLTADGFVTAPSAGSEPRAWEARMRAIPESRRQQMRALASARSASAR